MILMTDPLNISSTVTCYLKWKTILWTHDLQDVVQIGRSEVKYYKHSGGFIGGTVDIYIKGKHH